MDGTTNPNDSLMRLNGSGQKVGAAIVLKVMSGDVIDVAVKAFYKDQTYTAPNNSVNDILNALASGAFGLTGGSKGTLDQLNNTSTSPLLGALNSFISGNNPTVVNKPRAHLNWILLDEQFQYVSSYPQSGALAVGNYASNVLNTLAYTGIPITKNGYLYIYVNNETPGWDVFFDNMIVKHYGGAITEETHYYPFGLVISGISSSRLPNTTPNKPVFNGSIAVGISLPFGGVTANLNTAFSARSFGLGTTHGSNGSTEIKKDFVFSPSLTIGGGKGHPLALNTLSGNTATGVTNTSAGGFTLGSNFVKGSNGSQQVGYLGIKTLNTQINFFNEFLPILGDKKDRMNTGGGSLQVSTANGNSITVGADVYTGLKSPGENSDVGTGDNPLVFNQSPDQQALNNGQTYLNITGPFQSNFVIGGKSMMYLQNGIHALRKEKKFVSTASGL